MKSTISETAAIVTAFATGFVAGVLLAPRSGEHTRKRIVEGARERLEAAEKQLENVEAQIAELNESVQEKGRALTDKLRQAAHGIVEQHVPDLSEDTDEWSEDGEQDVVKDLRHMTRK